MMKFGSLEGAWVLCGTRLGLVLGIISILLHSGTELGGGGGHKYFMLKEFNNRRRGRIFCFCFGYEFGFGSWY